MIEALYAVVLGLGGFGLLVPWRRPLPSGAQVWVAVPTGVAVYLLVAVLMVAGLDRLEPLGAVAVTGMAGAVGVVLAARRSLLRRQHAVIAGWVALMAFTVAMVAWWLPLTRLTLDSAEYLFGARQIQVDGAPDLMAPFVLKRQMGFQALHALATSGVRGYVAWVGPLFGVAGTGLLAWLGWSHSAGSRGRRLAVVIGSVAFLVSSSRFFYDFFYVHPHIQMATFLLVAVAGAWLAITRDRPVWALAAGLCLAATVLLRPEAPLLAAAVLIPVAASPADRVVRRLMAIPALAVIVVWYGLVLWPSAPGGDAIGLTEPVFSSIVAVVASAGAVLVLDSRRLPRLTRWVGAAMIPGLVALLLIYTVVDPLILRDTIVATFRNQKRLGWWVTTWVVVVPLAAVALAIARFRLAELWSRVVVGFGLLFFIFPYLRGSPWRVGPGDSGNRMLAHFLLVVLAFVLVTFGAASDRQGTEAEPG